MPLDAAHQQEHPHRRRRHPNWLAQQTPGHLGTSDADADGISLGRQLQVLPGTLGRVKTDPITLDVPPSAADIVFDPEALIVIMIGGRPVQRDVLGARGCVAPTIRRRQPGHARRAVMRTPLDGSAQCCRRRMRTLGGHRLNCRTPSGAASFRELTTPGAGCRPRRGPGTSTQPRCHA